MNPFRLGLLLLLIPLADIIILILLARVHWGISLGIVLLTIVVGMILIRMRGAVTMWKLLQFWRQPVNPANLAIQSIVLLLAASLLIMPGIITDLIGISLLVPASRRWYGNRVTRFVTNRMPFIDRRFGRDVVEGQGSSRPVGSPSAERQVPPSIDAPPDRDRPYSS